MTGTPPTLRTTAALVGGIVGTAAGFDLTPFIAFANQLTTDACTYPQADQDPKFFIPYTDGFVGSKMELIERWLAAHFYTIYDNQLSYAKAGTVSVKYQYKVDYGLKCSMYGQQAMRMDTYGNLAGLDNVVQTKRKVKVGVYWAGTYQYPASPFGIPYPWADTTWVE